MSEPTGGVSTTVDTTETRIATMLEAGAVLPVGTPVSKEDTVDLLTARIYHHSALGDRTVVRLVPATLGEAEDLAMEFLLFDRPERVETVGVVRQQALGFPAWALVNDPANGHHALALVKEIERLTRMAKSRIGPAKDGFCALGDRLARAVPHFLPTYYEEAGRAFVAADSPSYAAMMFGKAREAERTFALDVDEDRQHAVFLEFALVGALTAKAVSNHSRDLAGRCDAGQAYERFMRLCAERTLGGAVPYAGMHTDLRRLAKAAKIAANVADDRILGEIISAPVLARAPEAFWTAYRPALVRLATADPAVRGRLLGLVPDNYPGGSWLELLTECGAETALTAPAGTVPAEAESPDGPAGWLSRYLAKHCRQWGSGHRDQRLLDLVTRATDRLIADGVPVQVWGAYSNVELDLLDQCLATGVPVADPPNYLRMLVDQWLADEGAGRRDLAAVAADPRFAASLVAATANFLQCKRYEGVVPTEVLRSVLAVPGLARATHDWLADRADQVERCCLPDLKDLLDLVAMLASPLGVSANPAAMRRIAEHDLVPGLGRTLRTGVLAEFVWPAWEEALNRLAGVNAKGEGTTLTAQWPYLLLNRGPQTLVLGPDGIVAEHLDRIPAGQHRWRWRTVRRYADGQILVSWDRGDDRGGYWSGTPDDVFVVPDDAFSTYADGSIELPGGGRSFGGRPLRAGDRAEQIRGAVISDGVTTWVRVEGETDDAEWRWREFDPATGALGRVSLPTFFEQGAVDGEPLVTDRCRLRPLPASVSDSPLGAKGGLVGWLVRSTSDRSQAGQGIDGRSVTLPGTLGITGALMGAVRFPGAEREVAVVWDSRYNYQGASLYTSDGFVAGRYPDKETPPVQYWHYLRPRDEAGSLALRALTDEQAAALLTGGLVDGSDKARDKTEIRALVGEVVPGIGDRQLVAGVARVVRRAAKRVVQLRALAATIAVAEAGAADGSAATAAVDQPQQTTGQDFPALHHAVDGLAPHRYGLGGQVLPFLTRLCAALDPATEAPASVPLPSVDHDWIQVLGTLPALLVRAVSPVLPAEQREALLTLAETIVAGGLCGKGSRVRLAYLEPEKKAADSWAAGRVLQADTDRLVLLSSYSGGQTVQFASTGTFAAVPGHKITSETRSRPCPITAAEATTLIELARGHGPAPLTPERICQLSAAAGMSLAEAALLLAGLPGDGSWSDEQSAEGRTELTAALEAAFAAHAAATGVAAGVAAGPALTTARRTWNRLGWQDRAELLAAALPEQVSAGCGPWPVLDRLAGHWTARHGRRTPVPDGLIVDLDRADAAGTRGASEVLHGLANPDTCRWLNTRQTDGASTLPLATVLPWLASWLPAEAPLRATLPIAARLARQRLTDPEVLIDCGYLSEDSVKNLAATFGVEVAKKGSTRFGAVRVTSGNRRIKLCPADLTGPDDPDLAIVEAHLEYAGETLDTVREWLSGRIEAMVAEPVPAGVTGYLQNPATCVPELVARVAEHTGLSPDAATLYLQLLALPDPTDRNVARWTGWKPARLKRARAELEATGHVVTAKRARSGRSLFLPGGWLELRTGPVPVERWKLPLITGGEQGIHSRGIALPVAQPPRLFALAWQRILDGDEPRFDELVTERRR